MLCYSALSKPFLRAMIARATDWTLWDEVSTNPRYPHFTQPCTSLFHSSPFPSCSCPGGFPFFFLTVKITSPIQKARRQVLISRKRPADVAKTRDETTVLDHLVHSNLVEKELGNGGFGRLAQLIQQAGAHNVSHTLSTIVTYLLLEPETKLAPLVAELEGIWTDRDEAQGGAPTWFELEKLPYLSACVKEGLR